MTAWNHANDWRRSLHFLRDHTGFSFVFDEKPPRTRADMSAAQDRVAWLRAAAAEGNPFALEELGRRLLRGDGLTASAVEAVALLKRACALGNPVAMRLLAEHWLAGGELRVDAEHLLIRATELRYLPAQVALATYLVRGTVLVRDAARGHALLADAARRGSRMAHIKLAAWLLGGRGLAADREAGLGWLLRLGAGDGGQVGVLASWLHSRALHLPPAECAEACDCAGILFREAVRLGNEDDEINLAYLLRRGEIAPQDHRPLDDLLRHHLAAGKPHALANQALRLARGADCAVDWHRADALVAAIGDVGSVFAWWSGRALQGDAEGHLLVAWLCRHRLVADPHGMTPAARWRLARAAGWDAPAWLEAASGPPAAAD